MKEDSHKPKIHPTADIGSDVEIGDFSAIGANAIIKGDVKIGREAWIAPSVIIGGGRAEMGSLRTGDFLHLGLRSFVNIADRVEIGNEVGIGVESKLYTHGAYLSEYDGFPYSVGRINIGNNVWIPNAMILPEVSIGNNVVIGAMSLVNSSIPSGCFAAGVPAVVMKRNRFPRLVSSEERNKILLDVAREANVPYWISDGVLTVASTSFIPKTRKIVGLADEKTERIKDLFRRRGIRFRYYNDGGMYREWD